MLSLNKLEVFLIFVALNIFTPGFALDVVFRCDDPIVSYDSISNRILDVFISNEVPLSIAMIPCNSDENPFVITDSAYWRKLHNPLVEICLHGLTHQNINKSGEFGSLSKEETARRIRLGKSILQPLFERPIETFIPPFNAINNYLPSILKEEGFYNVSSDLFDNIATDDVLYYPETLGHLMGKLGFWPAVEHSIFKNTSSSDLCVVMFHAYDLPNEASWQTLQTILTRCKSNPDIHLYVYRDLHAAGVDGSARRYNANNLESFLQKKYLSKGVLYSSAICYSVHVANMLCYVMLLLISCFISLKIAPKNKTKKIVVGLYTASMALVSVSALFHYIGPNKLWYLTIAISILLVAISFLLKKLRK